MSVAHKRTTARLAARRRPRPSARLAQFQGKPLDDEDELARIASGDTVAAARERLAHMMEQNPYRAMHRIPGGRLDMSEREATLIRGR